MSKVIFKKAAYRYKSLKPVIFEMIDSIARDLIIPRQRVLLKPNLLLAAKPEKAITTHPLVLRVVAEYVLDRGARPMIADSPPLVSFRKVLKEGGYEKAFRGLDVEFKAFEKSKPVDIGDPFGRIDIAADAMEADLVINLAKLKTHSQMLMTLGVKNLFGCIVGYKKPEWHVRAGIDRNIFARLLVQIYRAVNPGLTLVDGIWALEGQGPGESGTPRRLGVMIAGRNAIEIDRAICRMLHLDPDALLTNRMAKELGLVGETEHISGDFHMVNDFVFPDLGPLSVGPPCLQKMMRRHLIQRPVVDHKRCKRCQECLQYCPAGAILPLKEKIIFDYDRCIRCYCCVEICPHGALRATETFPGRIIRRLTGVR